MTTEFIRDARNCALIIDNKVAYESFMQQHKAVLTQKQSEQQRIDERFESLESKIELILQHLQNQKSS